MGNLFDREDLTDEQRQQAFRNMRQVWEVELDRNVDTWYAAATAEEKTAVLDEQIDRFRKRMEDWRKQREEWEKRRKERERRRAEEGRNANANESDDSPRRRWGERFRTREGRKEMSEGRDPDKSARRMAYFAAVMARMKERGIEMPMGPGRGGPRRGR
jgi:hypothetical protein